jgi:hypothetical protein
MQTSSGMYSSQVRFNDINSRLCRLFRAPMRFGRRRRRTKGSRRGVAPCCSPEISTALTHTGLYRVWNTSMMEKSATLARMPKQGPEGSPGISGGKASRRMQDATIGSTTDRRLRDPVLARRKRERQLAAFSGMGFVDLAAWTQSNDNPRIRFSKAPSSRAQS